jgi:hypothetical protein
MEPLPAEPIDAWDPPKEPVEVAWPPPICLPPPEEAEERWLIAVEWLPAGAV